jgi:hypothetical protein
MFEFQRDRRGLLVELKTTKSFPLWSYGTYLSRLDLAYRKIMMVDRIGQLVAAGYSDNQLAVAEGSIQPFPASEVSYKDFREYKRFSLKGDSPDDFWNQIVVRKRPAVFFKDDGYFKPILGLRDNELHLLNAKITSPGEFAIVGIAAALAQIYWGYEENRRREEAAQTEREVQEQRRKTELTRQLRYIAENEALLNQPNIPAGVRYYQRQTLEAIKQRHAQDASSLGISVTEVRRGIDLRA